MTEVKYNPEALGLKKPEGAIVDKESGAWLVNSWTHQKWGLTFRTKIWSDGEVEELVLLPDGTELVSLKGNPVLAIKTYFAKHPYGATLITIANIAWMVLTVYLKLRGLW